MNLKRILKIKSSGDDVIFLQKILKKYGFIKDKPTGYYNQNTLMCVSKFQKNNGLKVTGEVNIQTWDKLINFKNKNSNSIDTNLVKVISNGLMIYGTNNDVNFYNEETEKNIILLSNSENNLNPENLTKTWINIHKSDKEQLKRASHFVIGGKSNESSKWDGKVIRTFDDKYWSYPFYMNDNEIFKKVISIEICNLGPIIKINEQFYTLNGVLVSEDDVIELDHLGYKYYHKYTQDQIKNLENLLKYLSSKHNIKLKKIIYGSGGIKPFYDKNWFSSYKPNTNGLKTKNNILLGSIGISPQKELIDMLNSI